ncbi:Cobalamin synthesis protein cobW C-terminal domain-containing protein [Agreia bicolorata]|uniref:Cobalamin synthesis protein cobW C-terminal domain-containing protein n=1 Tax=Agreia bicolorata TaxID=110935 RepID=A0A1T4Y3E8_9MICO|nr:GTP-binding protein [Agreia bicolorata]SKA96354.1 Cobalamin synthesis protein cobW C-terminal domain-containing protein [Agreia bicolorata]
MNESYDSRPIARIAGLAVTLVSSSDRLRAEQIAAILSGCAVSESPVELDVGGDDDATFAVELAEQLASDCDDGLTGNTVVVLEAGADIVEIALVLEHMLEARRPRVPVGIRDVVAVTSVREVGQQLLGWASEASAQGDDFTSPGCLASRLEFASMIVLTDAPDAAAPADTRLVLALLARMAPSALVLTPFDVAHARQLSGLLVRGRARRLGASMGWQRELVEGAPAHPVSDACSTFVFRDPRPFHPGRLHAAVTLRLTPENVGCIARSRGFVRLATRGGRVGSWATAGNVLDLEPTEMLSWSADSPIGQEIAFFGPGLDEIALERTLSECLLTAEELAVGPEVWATYADPFPEWVVEHRH